MGRFYPTGTKPGTELPLYSQWCNAVEGNTTFDAEPPPATVAKWREQTSGDFRFAFKLPRTITHDKRLRDVAIEVRSFLDAIEPLGDRIGPIQVARAFHAAVADKVAGLEPLPDPPGQTAMF